MLREENHFYRKVDLNNTKVSTRPEKGTDETRDIKKEISRLEKSIYIITKVLEQEKLSDEKRQKYIELLDKSKSDLEFWNETIKSYSNLPQRKCLKRKTKKKKHDVLKSEILSYINTCKEKKIRYITKEDVAYTLQVKESDVFNIFHELNREGILSQAEHGIPHDSDRDHWCLGGKSAWQSDYYRILEV